jgi:hypothetical protein
MNGKFRLWRIELTHQMGYQAPSFRVETSSKLRMNAEVEAIRLAREKTRLGDFPNSWKITVYYLDQYIMIGNKWVLRKEFEEEAYL